MGLLKVNVFLIGMCLACGQVQDKDVQREAVSFDHARSTLKAFASEFRTASDAEDWPKVAGLTHDRIIEASGGQEAVISSYDQLGKRPRNYKSWEVTQEDPIEVKTVDGLTFGVVPERVRSTTMTDKEIITDTFLFAVSEDKGVTWKFAGTQVDDFFPEVKGKLENVPKRL